MLHVKEFFPNYRNAKLTPPGRSGLDTGDPFEGASRLAWATETAGRRSIGLQVFFHANLLQLGCFEFEDPRTVFKLVMVVEHRVVGFSVHPHSIDDFEPTLS